MSLSVFLALILAIVVNALNIGPCRKVDIDDVDLKQWEGSFYTNVVSFTAGLKCVFHERSVQYRPNEQPSVQNTKLIERFVYTENSKANDQNLTISYVDKGHYTWNRNISGVLLDIHSYEMSFHLPNYECHFTCSNNDLVKNGHASFWCSSAHPDPNLKNACEIKALAKEAGFSTSDLMVVNNCGCNIPYPKYHSACKTITAKQYFAQCN